MPTSSNARGRNGSFGARGLAASSVTARSGATQRGPPLALALRVRHQEQRQRGPKIHTTRCTRPKSKCIGRGKARAARVRLQGVISNCHPGHWAQWALSPILLRALLLPRLITGASNFFRAVKIDRGGGSRTGWLEAQEPLLSTHRNWRGGTREWQSHRSLDAI
jgi:hypothetical protein